MSWNPDLYLRFGSFRTRPALELLARVGLDDACVIYDLGCGPGNSTAVLHDRFPRANITGIDNSAEMLAQARRSGPAGVNWVLGDIVNFAPDAPADLLFSNAAFQWLSDQPSILERIFGTLRAGGVLAFQVPANFEEPTHSLIDVVADDLGIGAKTRAARERVGALKAAEYYRRFHPSARHLDIWDTEYLQPLEGKDAVLNWVTGTVLVPVLAALTAAERERFLADYGAALRKAYPREKNGKTLLPFRRRFVVAERA